MIVDDNSWRSFDVWAHFKHVGIEAFRTGCFDRWDSQQGKHRTFYAGGLFDFGQLEGTMQYSHYLVDRFFSGATYPSSEVDE